MLAIIALAFFLNGGDEPVLTSRVTVGNLGYLINIPEMNLGLERHNQAVSDWVENYQKWKTETLPWLSRCKETFWLKCASKSPMPEPPAGLDDDCLRLVDYPDDVYEKACNFMVEFRDDLGTHEIRNKIKAQRQEKPVHTNFLKYIQFDGWSSAQSTYRIFGGGIHFAIPIENKVYVFGAPGVSFLNVPLMTKNERRWTPAYNLGIGIKLFDYGKLRYCLTVSRAWINLGGNDVGALTSSKVNLIGLSSSFK